METKPSHDFTPGSVSLSVLTHYFLSIWNVPLRLSSCSWLRYDVLCLVLLLGEKVNMCLSEHQLLKDL